MVLLAFFRTHYLVVVSICCQIFELIISLQITLAFGPRHYKSFQIILFIYKIDRSYSYVSHVCCKLIWGLISILKVSCNFQTLGSINDTCAICLYLLHPAILISCSTARQCSEESICRTRALLALKITVRVLKFGNFDA